MTIRVRVALLVGVLVAVATAAASIGAYSASRDEAYDTVDDFLDERGERTVGAIAEFSTRFGLPENFELPPGVTQPRGQSRFVDDDSVVAITLPDDILATVPPSVLTDPDIELPPPSAGGIVTETVVIDGERYRLRSETLLTGVVVQVARSLEETDSTLSAIRTRLWVLGVGVTVGAVGLGWLAARRLARPLEQLSDAAEHITATGDLTTPLAVEAGGEVGQVSRSFSEMLAALDESRRQQQQLVVDAGHELRTPLTTLRTNADLLASGKLDAADTERALASIRAEVDELANLTTELVELSADAPGDPVREVVDLGEVVRGAADRASRRHGRNVVVDGESADVVGDPAQLDRAVTNLLDNAAKFSPEGAPIEVLVGSDRVEVADRGPGIDCDDLPHVFDRFYRATASRTLPGSGLGLAIVAQAAAAHGGDAYAANRREGAVVGFTFEPADATGS